MVKYTLLLLGLISSQILCLSQAAFRNPGLSSTESFELYELFDKTVGRIVTKFNIELKEKNHLKYYAIKVNEGNLFSNELEIKYTDLTTISEKRTDLKTGKLTHLYQKSGDTVHFINTNKGVNKTVVSGQTNIYSPLAYFFSFRGFPFQIGRSVSIKSYIYEYGDMLTMNVKNISKQTITVKAGTYECYVLELSVGGWQSVFAPDKYHLFFTVANPHIFVRYEEKIDGKWSADELIQYNK